MKNYKVIGFALMLMCSFTACKSKNASGKDVDSSSNAIKKSPKDTTPMSSGMSTSGPRSGTGTNGSETDKGTPVGAETGSGTKGASQTTDAGAETRTQKPQ